MAEPPEKSREEHLQIVSSPVGFAIQILAQQVRRIVFVPIFVSLVT